MTRLPANVIGLEINDKFIACEVSCSLNTDIDMMPATGVDSGRFKDNIAGLISWNISLNGMALINSSPTSADYITIFDAILSGDYVNVKIKTKSPGYGNFIFSGKALVKSQSFTANVNTMTTYDTTLEGCGELKYGSDADVTIEYGFTSVNPLGNEGSLSPQFSTDLSFGYTEVTMDFTTLSSANYLFVKVPDSELDFIEWYNNSFNFGDIPDYLWNTPTVVGGYTYYTTRNIQFITSSEPNIIFRNV